jgi:hypothetical protein
VYLFFLWEPAEIAGSPFWIFRREQMMLIVTKVPRALETKSKLFGFELGDILILFLYLSISNFIFGGTQFKFIFVWLGTLSLGLALHFLKKGKPEDHLQHLGEFYRKPEILSAANPDLEYSPYLKLEKEEDSNGKD